MSFFLVEEGGKREEGGERRREGTVTHVTTFRAVRWQDAVN